MHRSTPKRSAAYKVREARSCIKCESDRQRLGTASFDSEARRQAIQFERLRGLLLACAVSDVTSTDGI